jgi:hypothetical protein
MRPGPKKTVAFRASSGIPEYAGIMGGLFRFVPMKAPDLWLEAMLQVLRDMRRCYKEVFAEHEVEAMAEICR